MEDLSRLESMQGERGGAPEKKDLDLSEIVTMRDVPDGVLARIDQYELVRELGGGGFGTVYLAKDTVSGVEYAVKGLPPEVKNSREELENIRANFALVSRLYHPNIAAALHLHPARDVRYGDESVRQKLRVMPGETLMVMEYAPGVTLSKLRGLFPAGKVPLRQALEITRQIAAALDYAHEQQIIHRDIKPSNVMVETKKDGKLVARVLDFGLAAEIRSSMGRVSREVRDTSGTRPYMAPEQWLGEKQGPASDQYALAVLVHELLTGEVPFASAFGTGDFELMKSAVTTIPFAAPEELPQPVRSALERALAKKSAERFASCGTFVAALEGEGTAAMPPGGTGRESPAPQRQPDASHPIDRPKPPSPRPKLARRRVLSILAGVGFVVFWGLWYTVTRDREARLEEKVQLWESGPYWASKNIGADKPEDYGLYFWWGDTEGRRPSGTTFSCSFDSSNTPTCDKNISTLQSEGWIVSKNGTYVLAPAHDAAHVKWGGGWRIPTEQELTDLNGKCDWRWTTRNGVNGYVVRGRGAYVSNSIFLPCAGRGYGTSLSYAGSYGIYWSSVPYSGYYYSWLLLFNSGGHDMYYGRYRYYGQSVRPVQGFTK